MSVKINEAFFEELGHNPGVVAACEQVAETILAKAVAGARGMADSGKYADSLHIERAERAGRVVFLVVADDPGALAIEARTGNLAKATRK